MAITSGWNSWETPSCSLLCQCISSDTSLNTTRDISRYALLRGGGLLAVPRVTDKALWEFITRLNGVGNKLSKGFFAVFIFLINNSVVLSQLLRSSLVNHRIQAKLARELGLDKFINFGGQVSVSLLSPWLTVFYVFSTCGPWNLSAFWNSILGTVPFSSTPLFFAFRCSSKLDSSFRTFTRDYQVYQSPTWALYARF